MKITYSRRYAIFTINSALAPDTPIRFKLTRKKADVEAARARLEKNLEWLERDLAKENLGASAIPAELKRRARLVFRRTLAGKLFVKVTDVRLFKVATHLDERGRNAYRVVREERDEPHFEWR